jgi:2-oxoacid dehydrogenases acyltransferase (catalytic domain)
MNRLDSLPEYLLATILKRLVVHRHVDVNTIVEVATSEGPFTLPYVIRDADIRSVAALSSELRSAKRGPSSTPAGRLLERAAPLGTKIPGAVPAMYAVMGRSVALHRQTGTVAVTAVGMFAGGGGFALAPLSLMSLQVVVGGMSARPRVVNGQVVIRDVLDLTVSVDHNVVDGAPAARFGAHLRELVEAAAAISALS